MELVLSEAGSGQTNPKYFPKKPPDRRLFSLFRLVDIIIEEGRVSKMIDKEPAARKVYLKIQTRQDLKAMGLVSAQRLTSTITVGQYFHVRLYKRAEGIPG